MVSKRNQLICTAGSNSTKLSIFMACLITVSGCLITNCPRGGKRSGKFLEAPPRVKQCIPCGPGGTGQCFGPKICCGPFGCLLDTPDSIHCQNEGMFYDLEPCTAGTMNCRKNTGRCATNGICCSQDSCHIDKECLLAANQKLIGNNLATLELFNILGYQKDIGGELD